MSNSLMTINPETMSKLALAGDVGGLNPQEKIQYYAALCERVGLDPATQPFKLMRLSGKEVFYLDRSGAQQLNRLHQISHEIKSREFVNGCYVVTARASIGNRFTDSIGAVACEGLKGEPLANATMKAETKAKRRATLDLVGLGMLDETEVETIPAVQKLPSPVVLMPPQPQHATLSPLDTKKTANRSLARSEASTAPSLATDAHRKRLIELLTPLGNAAIEYCQKSGMLLPTETLDDLPLRFVPATKEQKDDFMVCVQSFVDGGEAKKPGYVVEDDEIPMDFPKDQSTGGDISDTLKRLEQKAQAAANRIVGKIQAISQKSGTNKKTGKPWTKYGIKIADGYLDTFDSKIAETCEQAKEDDKMVDIEYQDKPWGVGKTSREIVSCILVEPQSELIP